MEVLICTPACLLLNGQLGCLPQKNDRLHTGLTDHGYSMATDVRGQPDVNACVVPWYMRPRVVHSFH